MKKLFSHSIDSYNIIMDQSIMDQSIFKEYNKKKFKSITKSNQKRKQTKRN